MWSCRRAVCCAADCLCPVCGRHGSRWGRGCLVVCPSQSLSQCLPLRLWYCGVGPVVLPPSWCIDVRAMCSCRAEAGPAAGWLMGVLGVVGCAGES